MKKTFLKTALMTMAGVCVLAGSAMAAPYITGGIGMTGVWAPTDIDGANTTISLSTGIKFVNNTFDVNTASESFSGLVDTTGNIYDFQFASFVAGTEPTWSVGGFSFVMDDLEYLKGTLGNNHNITLNGTGTLKGVGYNNTPGSWSFSSQGAGNANFTWSGSSDADVAANPVPEPATMLLFGAGLMGLAFVGRKIRE